MRATVVPAGSTSTNIDLGTVDGRFVVVIPQNWTVKSQSAKPGIHLAPDAKIVLGMCPDRTLRKVTSDEMETSPVGPGRHPVGDGTDVRRSPCIRGRGS
jgi:hypothetical protein